MHLSRRFTAPVAVAILLAACSAPVPTAQDDTRRESVKTGGASGTLPTNGAKATTPGGPGVQAGQQAGVQAGGDVPAGLVRTASAVPDGMVAIVDANGQPIPGATVTIGQLRATANEQGLVTLPAAAVTAGGDALLAIVEAEGRVPASVSLKAGFGVQLASLDKAASSLTVAAGGIAKNMDDTMRVTFAPGSLAANGDVRVTRLYSDSEAALAAAAPHVRQTVEKTFMGNPIAGAYSYHLDLPEGHLAPGADVVVDFKVEPKLATYLDQMSKVPGWLEKGEMKGEFRKDPAGSWWFSMKVPTPPPAPAAAAGPKGYKIAAASCATHNDVETYYVPDQRLSYRDAVRYDRATEVVAQWETRYYSRPVQHCDPVPGGVAVHDPAINGGHCYYTSSCPDIVDSYQELVWVTREYYYPVIYQEAFWEAFMRQEQRTWTSQSINARVTYLSDDARFAGKAIANMLVNFSHAGTVMRNAILGGYTGGDGIATGEGQAGMPGRAQASATEPYTYSTAANYSVNCGTVDVNIVKNRPRVNLKGNAVGTAIGGAQEFPTPIGGASVSPGQTTTWAPGIDGNSYSLAIGGTRQLGADGWLDYNAPTTSINWNGNHDVPVELWYSRTATASGRWVSDDASVPADQRPATKWHAQPIAKATYTFAHPVSGSAKKPGNRDLLSFADAASATAWGQSGSTGTVTVAPAASAISLSGTGSTVLNGGSSVVDVTANLPKVTFTLASGAAGEYVLAYELTRSDGKVTTGEMNVNIVGNSATVAMPIDEPVGTGFTHSFKIKHMRRGNFADAITMPDGNLTFPALGGLKRGMTAAAAYPTVISTFVTPK